MSVTSIGEKKLTTSQVRAEILAAIEKRAKKATEATFEEDALKEAQAVDFLATAYAKLGMSP